MFKRRLLLLATFAILPAPAIAEVAASAIPGGAVWYLHVDLEELRTAGSGRKLYAWLDSEIFQEVREDLGIDLNREANSVTAFSDAALGTVIVVDGALSEDTRNKLMAIAAVDATLDLRRHRNRTYYHADRSQARQVDSHHSLNELQKAAYFSLDIENKLIITSREEQMEDLLNRGGRLAGNQSHAGALFVLTADKNFVQAGVRTDELGRDGNGWDSNILRHTEQVALLVADQGGRIAIEAQLVSREPRLARSLAGIMNGLISLQMLNDSMEPRLLELIQNTRIEVKDAVLSINAVLDPATIAALIEGQESAR